MPRGLAQASQSQPSASARGIAGGPALAGAGVGSLSFAAMSGSANANWQSLLAALGVRGARQEESGTATEVGLASGASAEEGTAETDAGSSSHVDGAVMPQRNVAAKIPWVRTVSSGVPTHPRSPNLSGSARGGVPVSKISLGVFPQSEGKQPMTGARNSQESISGGTTHETHSAKSLRFQEGVQPDVVSPSLYHDWAVTVSAPLAAGIAAPSKSFEPVKTNHGLADRAAIGTEADDNIVAMAAMPKLATSGIQLSGSQQLQGEKVVDHSTSRVAVPGVDTRGSQGALPSVTPVRADGPSRGGSVTPPDRQELTTTNPTSAEDEAPVVTVSLISSSASHPVSVQREVPRSEPLSKTNPGKSGSADASLVAANPAEPASALPGLAPIRSAPAANSRSLVSAQERTVRVAGTAQRSETRIHLVQQQRELSIPGTIGSGQSGTSGQAGMRLAQGLSGESYAAPANHSGPPSGEAFAALDGEVAPGTPTWIHAGTQRAEAGFQDPNLGWVSVRADSSGGGIHAALVPSSTDAAQTLGGQMAGLNSYLTEHHTPLATLTIATPESRAGMAGMDSSGNESMHQQSGQTDDQAMRQGSGQQGSDLRVSRAEISAAVLPAVSISPGRSEIQSTATASGHHISVVA